jgi:alpha-glucosidase (family GH31 glycosyl hydrolase)
MLHIPANQVLLVHLLQLFIIDQGVIPKRFSPHNPYIDVCLHLHTSVVMLSMLRNGCALLLPIAGSGVTSEPYRLYNLDVFEYEHSSHFGLYGAIPMMLAHKKGQTTGIFW